MIATRLKIGPADHGREVSEYEAELAEYEEGYRYEHIDGRIEVAPAAGFPEVFNENWLQRRLDRYAELHPDVIGYLTPISRVYVPARLRVTVPEPDLALYRERLAELNIDEVHWRDVSPFLVVEVLVDGNPKKDLVRNVELYFQVPSIEEYWVLDGRASASRPNLIVHRRGSQEWEVAEVPFGELYTTPVLPGFELIVDPKAR